jgi:5'-methylthioadenosine phosphorylase
MKHRIGVIGGSGLYEMDELTNVREVRVETPYGEPSDALICGELDGAEMVFLPRHGRGHRLTPSEVPYRANIYAMKSLGVNWIISVSAVGSLRERVVPGHVVLVDQFIDRTRNRAQTFFGEGIVAHVAFGNPVCETLRSILLQAAKDAGATAHDRGTYVCMEGPLFSTRAESEMYRSWGATVIGMTNLPEAKLAREAEISYATLALSTDYDCWHTGHDDVTVDQVIEVVRANVQLARSIVQLAVPGIVAHEGPNPMHDALANSIMTAPQAIPAARRQQLDLLLKKYLP